MRGVNESSFETRKCSVKHGAWECCRILLFAIFVRPISSVVISAAALTWLGFSFEKHTPSVIGEGEPDVLEMFPQGC